MAEGIRLCKRVAEGKECVYLSVQKMVNGMKQDIARTQSIAYPEQIVVAKIYEVVSELLSEACRRNFSVERQDCEPSSRYRTENLTMDTFILLNQIKEDGFITEDYKRVLFDSLVLLNPDMKKVLEEDSALGLI